jgi:hypothetical protein
MYFPMINEAPQLLCQHLVICRKHTKLPTIEGFMHIARPNPNVSDRATEHIVFCCGEALRIVFDQDRFVSISKCPYPMQLGRVPEQVDR